MRGALRGLPVLALLLLTACDPSRTSPQPPPGAPPAASRDLDSDGVVASQDCADDDASRHQRLPGFEDGDGDGVGSGPQQQVCSGATLPPGWAQASGDCAPANAAQWQLQSLYRDSDQDGRTVGEASSYCVGAALPAGLTAQQAGADCNDTDALAWRPVSVYADVDLDGVGAGELEQRCVGEAMPVNVSLETGDCAPWDVLRHTLLAYTFRDADGDGATVPSAGEVCAGFALPQGYATAASGEDCDDTSAQRYQQLPVFVDADGDGVGAGASVTVCAGPSAPEGYSAADTDCAAADAQRWEQRDYPLHDADGDGRFVSLAAAASFCVGSADPQGYARTTAWPEDCDDAQASRWQQLAYAHRDADGDGRTVPEQGQQCSGAALPAGYATAPSGADCNDADAQLHTQLTGYADADGDQYGGGEAQGFCTGGSLPAGYLATGTDCAPGDATRFRIVTPKYLDQDGDGHTVPDPAPTAQCIGVQAPPPSVILASGNDCRDDDAALFRWRVLYPDADGDGVGTPPRQVLCQGLGAPPAGLSPYGWDSDDQDPDEQVGAGDRFVTELLLGL